MLEANLDYASIFIYTKQSDIYRTQYTSFPRAFASIVRSGPNELFKGFIPSAMRDAPYAGIFVALYESIKRQTCEIIKTSNAFVVLTHGKRIWRGPRPC